MRKSAIEERRAIAEENKIMVMNRNDIDELTKECHDITRKEILKRRRQMVKAMQCQGFMTVVWQVVVVMTVMKSSSCDDGDDVVSFYMAVYWIMG